MTPKLQQALRYISSEAGKREVNAFIRMHNRNRSKFRIIIPVPLAGLTTNLTN